ncbi:extracellular matrix-binding protein ebh [Striga asiatica]|uniref:Extracellular matrix-binding protein ebh n=1 Tax=Striga asiatica TaxID=4170 RepID=A0A5A7QRR4_STRAF|nr:extracellular matrix-binding protein ebh [Striga asiatica]
MDEDFCSPSHREPCRRRKKLLQGTKGSARVLAIYQGIDAGFEAKRANKQPKGLPIGVRMPSKSCTRLAGASTHRRKSRNLREVMESARMPDDHLVVSRNYVDSLPKARNSLTVIKEQLSEEERQHQISKGQCFRCNEKFASRHRCKQQLYAIEGDKEEHEEDKSRHCGAGRRRQSALGATCARADLRYETDSGHARTDARQRIVERGNAGTRDLCEIIHGRKNAGCRATQAKHIVRKTHAVRKSNFRVSLIRIPRYFSFSLNFSESDQFASGSPSEIPVGVKKAKLERKDVISIEDPRVREYIGAEKA